MTPLHIFLDTSADRIRSGYDRAACSLHVEQMPMRPIHLQRGEKDQRPGRLDTGLYYYLVTLNLETVLCPSV
jgi:hypothetical protein